MAWLESRNGSCRIVFRYQETRYSFTIGEVGTADAAAFRASTEELLRLLKRKLMFIPPGCSVEDFMLHRGRPPAQGASVVAQRKELTLDGLREGYFRSQEHKLEQTTLDGIRLHFDHLTRILSGKRMVATLTRTNLQEYVDARSKEWIDPNIYRKKRRAKMATQPKRTDKRKAVQKLEAPDKPRRHPSAATIKKEIISLRTAWNWARRSLGLTAEFPGTSLDYAKIEESLPFMTWAEAEYRIAAGDDPEKVWACLYLRPVEIADLLSWVKPRPVSPWVYPMLCFAAYTGSRRSEIVRTLTSDVDLANSVVTIREKKRDKKKITTRRVPLTAFLTDVLSAWMDKRSRGKTLFCKDDGREIKPREAHNYFQRALRVSKWSVLKGWHVFRHSFISSLASQGVDQRIIDDLVGHSTEEQRRRYRHLFPDVKQQAMLEVFG